jgi:hypothetical protein
MMMPDLMFVSTFMVVVSSFDQITYRSGLQFASAGFWLDDHDARLDIGLSLHWISPPFFLKFEPLNLVRFLAHESTVIFIPYVREQIVNLISPF